RRHKKWPEAGVWLTRAEESLGNGGPDGQRRRARQARADLTMATTLEEIRLQPVMVLDGQMVLGAAGPAYAQAFAQYLRLKVEADNPAVVGRQIQGKAIQEELVAALTDWAVTTRDNAQRSHLLNIVRQVDRGELWDQLWDAVERADRQALEGLAGRPDVMDSSPVMLLLLGRALAWSGADPVPFLRRAQARYPDDPWLGFDLAGSLALTRPGQGDEAIGFYRAALAVRPTSHVIYANLS